MLITRCHALDPSGRQAEERYFGLRSGWSGGTGGLRPGDDAIFVSLLCGQAAFRGLSRLQGSRQLPGALSTCNCDSYVRQSQGPKLGHHVCYERGMSQLLRLPLAESCACLILPKHTSSIA